MNLADAAVNMHWYAALTVEECADILKGFGVAPLEGDGVATSGLFR